MREWWLEDCNNNGIYDNDCNDLMGYNCGGFALNTRDWYLPYDTNKWAGAWEIEDRLGIELALEIITNHMLSEFPNLRLVQSEEDLKDSEVLILFRMSNFDDFHFVRKGKNGKYYHKMGWSPVIEEMSKEEVYGDCWCNRYDGDIVLFGYEEKNS
jgi:hypothetical protein